MEILFSYKYMHTGQVEEEKKTDIYRAAEPFRHAESDRGKRGRGKEENTDYSFI